MPQPVPLDIQVRADAPDAIRFDMRRLDTGESITLEIRWEPLVKALADAGFALVPLPTSAAALYGDA